MTQIDAKTIIAAAEVSEAEMACRLIEAVCQTKRPAGMTAAKSIAFLDAEDREQWLRAARSALQYLSECLAGANTIQ